MSTIYTTTPNFPASEGRSGETFYNATTSWFMSNQQPAPGFRALSPFNVESIDGTINTRITAGQQGGSAVSEVQLISSGTQIGEFNISDTDGANVQYGANQIQNWSAGISGTDPQTRISGRTTVAIGLNTPLVIDQAVLPVLGTTTTFQVGSGGSNNISMRPNVTLIEESTLFSPSGITVRDGTAGANPTNLLTITPNLIQQSQFGQTILNIGTDSFPNARGFITHPQGSSRNLTIGNNSTIIHDSTIFTPGNGVRVFDGNNVYNRFASVLPSTLTFTSLGGVVTALECNADLNKWTTLFGNDYIYLETQAYAAPGRNRAIDLNGLINNGGGIYGRETHYWDNLFFRPITATTINATTVSTTTANITTANITNASITNINGAPAGNGGLIPVGALLPWAPAVYTTTTPPVGYLFCDGAVYANGVYPALAALLGTTYGGTVGVNFAVPDMRWGKSIIGGAVNNQTTAITNPGGAGRNINIANSNSITVQGVEYGTTNRAIYIKPYNDAIYRGVGLRAGYSFTVNGGDGTIYNIIDTMGAPYGNNNNGPQYNLFLLDIAMTGTDIAAIGTNPGGGITAYPYAKAGTDLNGNPNLLPDVRAGSVNNYLNYTQRAAEVGPIQYNVFQGGVTAAAGAAWRAGDPNLVSQSPYLNGLGQYVDFNNNTIRSPVGSSIPSAYSYAMGYIIKF
jgi:hypothetical protein